MIIEELAIHFTWAFPFIGSIAVFIFTAIGKKSLRGYFAVTMLFISAVASTLLLSIILNRQNFLILSYPWLPTLGVDFGFFIDSLSAFMIVIVTWLCALIGLYSLRYMRKETGLTRYWFFFTFFTGSMLLIIMSNNLILMFIGWEGTGLASYALIGHYYTDQNPKTWVGEKERKTLGSSMGFSPSHSGIRALVFTRLGDVGLISGIAVLYMLTNSLNIQTIANTAETWGAGLFAKGILLPFLLFFSLGALAKSAQFPFHEWIVTAMTGPTPVSALIHAATMVKAGVFFMLRFAPIFFIVAKALSLTIPAAASQVSTFFAIIAFIGAFTAFLMATQGVVAKELKLVLAFSTASQLGYMFLAIGAAGLVTDFVNGFVATFSHLMSHAIFKAALFLAAGAVIHTVGSRYMSNMGGLRKIMKITFGAMLIAAFSLSGLPPLMGFWTKDLILDITLNANLLIPIILAIVTVAITAFYSMRLVMKTFVAPASINITKLEEKQKVHEAHPLMLAPYTFLALITAILGVAWLFIGGNFYNALTKNVLALGQIPILNVELNPLLTGISVGMVGLGLITAYIIYGKPIINKQVTDIIEKKKVLTRIYNFLYDRWYIQGIYYKIFVFGGNKLSKNSFKLFETNILDRFYHRFIPWVVSNTYDKGFHIFETGGIDKLYHSTIVNGALSISKIFKKIQSGKINHYIFMMLIGFVILIALFFWGVA
jgi:NADH-quinone oxidoreductase subunit L